MGVDPGRTEATEEIQKLEIRRRLPAVILVGGLVVSGAVLLHLTSRLSFIADDWNLLIQRQGWGLNQFLDHFNGHPIMAPTLIYKVLLEVFGMNSARPMQVAAIATFLLMNVLLFLFLRRRVGDWAALIGTFLILFLGAAFEDLLWAFQIGFFGSLAAGIGALLALDRDNEDGDIFASILFLASITFSSIGLAFVAIAVVEWLLNPRDRRRRWFVPGISIVFYGVWWIGWGTQESTTSLNPEFSFSVLSKVPEYVFDAFAAGLTSLAGLATGDGSEPDQPNLIWGQLGAVALIMLAIQRMRSLGGPPRDFLFAGSGLLALLLLFAIGQDGFAANGGGGARPPTSSRYQLPIAIFIMITAATLLHGLRPRPWVLGLGAALAIVAILNGTELMVDRASTRWRSVSEFQRGKLAGAEAARPDAPRNATLDVGTVPDVPLAAYYRAVDRFGSPAYPTKVIRGLNPSVRIGVDSGLVQASGIALNAEPPEFRESDCTVASRGAVTRLGRGNYAIRNRGPGELAVNLAQVSNQPGLLAGAILPAATAGLELPTPRLSEAWTFSFAGEGPVEVCRGRSNGG